MEEEKKYSIREYILFKIDRTVELLGLIGLGVTSILGAVPEVSQPTINNIITALSVYVGARVVK